MLKNIIIFSLSILLIGFDFQPKATFPSDREKVVLAQILLGEADNNKKDHIAILWVLHKRWEGFKNGPYYDEKKHTFLKYISQYSSVMKVNTKRARAIRRLKWNEDPPKNSPFKASSWNKIKETVDLWYQGYYKDPCKSAIHWGSITDGYPAETDKVSWQKVSCGRTKNLFYKRKYKR